MVARWSLRTTTARACAFGSLFALALGSSGCPGGAVLEEPERFPQYLAGAPGAGAPGAGAGGSEPVAGAAGAGGAVAGASGSGGVPGAGGTGLSCDITVAMKENCLTGCHTAAVHYANLDFSNVAIVAMQMVDKPALHIDLGCNAVGAQFRQCTPEELTALGCPPGALLIDSKDFEQSWVVKKLDGEQLGCGDAMPLPPGNAVSRHWDAARKTCLLEFFRSLIPTP